MDSRARDPGPTKRTATRAANHRPSVGVIFFFFPCLLNLRLRTALLRQLSLTGINLYSTVHMGMYGRKVIPMNEQWIRCKWGQNRASTEGMGDVVSPIKWFILHELQCVDDDVVPLPSLLEVSFRSILEKNLVALLNIDRLVCHFLAQHRDIFTFDGLFQ